MAATSTREESFTSPASLPPQDYDVFLSFRGEDTRKNFTDHLYAALVRHGFYTFRDDNKLKRGEVIGSELLKAIEGSRISVIVFSRNYADSRWCLDELVKILECKSSFQQIVLPVFYHVDPSDVRAQRGSFAEAFAKHEERYKGRGMEDKLQKWRAALTQAANLSGYDLRNLADGHESQFIDLIVKVISKKLNLSDLNVAIHPVGMKSRVQHVNMLLSFGSNNVHMVGIWGAGGIGKTTIAKAIFNQIHGTFEGSSFLANVREISKQPNGLVVLQEQLLSDILMEEIRNISIVEKGIEVIKRRLWCRRKVLVVLDDVDHRDQLNALAIDRDFFHLGSRIIVTTRDKSLLNILGVDKEYMPELLTYDESLQLFNWHAFRKDYPIEDYVKFSREVVGYVGGLPLALEVLGSFFKGMSMPEWEYALERLKVIPHEDIQSKLRISFDSLNVEQQDIFLDIACFFVGCGFFPKNVLGVLSRKCLVKIDGLNRLTMHDMIRDMGREIVRRECPEEPKKRSRLWLHEDVLEVLRHHQGTEAVKGLVLNLPRSNDVPVNTQAFAKMNKLRLLKLHNVSLSGSYEHLSKRLSRLYWFGCPLKSIPSNLFMEKVVAIDIRYSCLKQVWEGSKILNKLKFLDLSHSYCLTKTPDFSRATGLETLLLNNCIRLVEVHQSIECLDKLVVLEMSNCKNLSKLPLGIWKLTSLQNLSLSGCSKLEKLLRFEGSPSKSERNHYFFSCSPASTQGLISLKRLDIHNCNLSYVPDEIGSLISLESLDLTGSKILRELPLGIWKLTSLKYLSLNCCSKLENMSGFKGSPSKSQFSPTCTKGLISLRRLDMRHCNLSYLPDELWSSISLEELLLVGNKNLREIPQGIWKLTSLKTLFLPDCSKLEKISESQASPASTQGLISLTFFNKKNYSLSFVPDELESLISLKFFNFGGNNFCTLPASTSHVPEHFSVDVSHCTRLQSLPDLPVNLVMVVASNCISLERISIGSNFKSSPSFSFSCCHKLVENNIASIVRKSLLQNQEFSIIYPGGEVPDYFNYQYQSEGSVLSFDVSLPPDRKIQGWTLCLVIAGCIDQMVDEPQSGDLFYEIKNKTKGFKINPTVLSSDYPPFPQDHLWLHHVPHDFDFEQLQLEDGDEVEYSVKCCPYEDEREFQVRWCGVNLIYEDDEKDQAMIEVVGDNKIVRHSYTSPAAATGTSRKRKRDDGDKSCGRKWKIPNDRPLFDDVATEVDDNDASDDSDTSDDGDKFG